MKTSQNKERLKWGIVLLIGFLLSLLLSEENQSTSKDTERSIHAERDTHQENLKTDQSLIRNTPFLPFIPQELLRF